MKYIYAKVKKEIKTKNAVKKIFEDDAHTITKTNVLFFAQFLLKEGTYEWCLYLRHYERKKV